MNYSFTRTEAADGRQTVSMPVEDVAADIRVTAAFNSLDVGEWATVLQPFGIIVVPTDLARVANGRDAHSPVVVLALVEADDDVATQAAPAQLCSARHLVARFAANGVATIVVTQKWRTSLGTYLQAGASGIILADSTPAQKAASIWSALAQCLRLREAGAEVQKLQRLLDRTTIVQRAAAFMAQSLRISQDEAVRQLRARARHSRSSMELIAQKIVEAQAIMGQQMPADGRADGRRS